MVFEPLGEVSSTTILRHERTGQPVGVGVVVMPDTKGLLPVTNALVGVQIDGRDLNIGEPRAADRGDAFDRRSTDRGGVERRRIVARGQR